MERAGSWRWWFRSWFGFRRNSVAKLVSYPPGWRWWHRFTRRNAPAAPAYPTRVPPFVVAPEDELGVAIPARGILASTDDIVLALTGCVAYSSGFQVSIGLVRRQERELSTFGVQGLRPPIPEEPPELSLELGVKFADGRETKRSRRTMNEEMMAFYAALQEGREPALPAGPVLSFGGGGGGRRWDVTFWVWPLPPEGPVVLSCEWAAGSIVLTTTELDGAAIRRAGLSSTKLWEGSSS